MRIMHLINHCGKANGHVNVSIDMACTQAKAGHTVAYCSSGGDYTSLLEQHGVELFQVPEPHRSIRNFLLANRLIWKAVRKFQPNIIHVHMAAQSVLVQPLRLLGYKVVTTVHNEFDRSVWLMGLSTRIVTVSHAGAVAMRKRGFGEERVKTVLNGTIGSPRLPTHFTAAPIQKPAIVTVCGLHHRKGVADLINAFKIVSLQFPETQLYIIGEGPSRSEYEALSESLGLDGCIHFMGYHADPREYLYPADIFVLASHSDPGPLVIAEARNAGCAIVASNVDGIPEMLDHGEAGILVPPAEPELLAAALTKLLSDPEEIRRFSCRAKANIERFTVDRVCREIDVIYERIAG